MLHQLNVWAVATVASALLVVMVAAVPFNATIADGVRVITFDGMSLKRRTLERLCP
ncbi:hypothetical protein D9619_010316 [Psilocybe cf. subviscida]|uniref:Uncharacterized protein n=1 Tax=Psilocybe cf. subviscida TaxID=2480587 RepID=A0A8H5AST5_9AGAR|nr:hypothetical protein D9619_010316 [Psilocybe cf. subviscida]